MVGHFLGETIANWAGDFIESDAGRLFPETVRDVAPTALALLLGAACDARQVEPPDLGEADLKTALLDHVAKLGLPEDAQPFIPSLCRAFLTDLQTRGRLGNGSGLGRYVGALKAAYLEASRDRPATFVRPGAKIGRNDPCPCGSGKKYKACCSGR